MFLLWHPWLTTTNLSYSFPILKLPPPPCAVLLVILLSDLHMNIWFYGWSNQHKFPLVYCHVFHLFPKMSKGPKTCKLRQSCQALTAWPAREPRSLASSTFWQASFWPCYYFKVFQVGDIVLTSYMGCDFPEYFDVFQFGWDAMKFADCFHCCIISWVMMHQGQTPHARRWLCTRLLPGRKYDDVWVNVREGG